MRISEFCKTFQVSHQAVYAKIKKYAAELEGHISKDKGNVTDLDPFAVNLLKPKKASYKALDERNYYLFKKNKEIVSENESIRAERDELASKKSDYEAVIEYLKKENKEYAEVRKSFEVLNFIHSKHIHSLDDMRACLAAANRKEDIAMHRYFRIANKKEQLKTLDYLGDEYARLLKTENRDEAQQKRLEKLHWQLMISGGIGGWDTHMENWLPKLKDKLHNDLRQLDSFAAEMGRASKERTNAETALAYLEDFLKSDYDRIREQEQLRIQIENYHNGLEPQEDGTYKAESEPTAERNAEFAYLDMREEQRRRAEGQRRRDQRQREMRSRSRSGYCR